MDKKPETTAAKSPTVKPSGEPRNFLATMLLVGSFGYFGLHQVYLGNKSQGWTRFGLAIASFPLMPVLIGYLIMLVLFVWTVVDFFRIYLGDKVDAEGQAMVATERDKTGAKALFIATLVVAGIYIVGIILAIMLGAFTYLQNGMNNGSRYDTPSRLDSSYYGRYR